MALFLLEDRDFLGFRMIFTLHPQKFGCTPKNEGKRVHVPPDEKNLWAY
jgi:hypothetical protein